MEYLTADGDSPPESPGAIPPGPATEPELDRALARAIRRLIANARECDRLPGPAV